MVKNFSCNTGRVNKTRNKSDFYQTPYSMTKQLLENENFNYNEICSDPCCGEGAIIKVLKQYFDNELLISSDIKFGYDFLKEELYRPSYIITNPPFYLAGEFIKKAKQITQKKFAFLLPLSYLHGQKRYEEKIFRDIKFPLTRIYVFTRYPLLSDKVREDGKYKTGMMVYAWYIWENISELSPFIQQSILNKSPQIKWINNQDYILKRGE